MTLRTPRQKYRCRSAGARERGTALVMSMVILLVLTIIGVAAMSTASLEERMAGNTQEATHALQVGQSLLSHAWNAPLSLTSATVQQLPDDFPNASLYPNATGSVVTGFTQRSAPPTGYAMDRYDGINFNQRVEVTTAAGARVTLNRGIIQVTPNTND